MFKILSINCPVTLLNSLIDYSKEIHAELKICDNSDLSENENKSNPSLLGFDADLETCNSEPVWNLPPAEYKSLLFAGELPVDTSMIIVFVYFSKIGIDSFDFTDILKDTFPNAVLVAIIDEIDLRSISFLRQLYDYIHLTKSPFQLLQSLLSKILLFQNTCNKRKVLSINDRTVPKDFYDGYIFESKRNMDPLFDALAASNDDENILLLGETGVGKEIYANLISRYSDRGRKCGKDQPSLISVNCAGLGNFAYSELFGHIKGAYTDALEKTGRFQEAHNRTLFLDEIGELDDETQAMLLRVMAATPNERTIRKRGSREDIKVNVRIIAATNIKINPYASHIKNKFRPDLFERFVWKINLLPLRERPEDIGPLANHFLSVLNKERKAKKSFDSDFLKLLQDYEYPRNIRELENIIKRAFSRSQSDLITVQDLDRELMKISPSGFSSTV